MKKILALLVLFFTFILTGCNPSNYSADSIKSNLEKNGYTVEVNPTVVNLDTSKMEGLQTIVYGYKGEYGTLFFVFDSTANANKLTDANPVPAHVSIIMDWGKDHAKENNKEFGAYNNVVYSGDKDIRKASGIKLATD